MNWKIALAAPVLALLGGALAVGCGGDDCTLADDHFAECTSATISGGGTENTSGASAQVCSGARLCQSQCINQHDCKAITGNSPDYLACLASCQGK